MITYRSAIEFETRFSRRETRRPGQFDAEYYLRRQGEKLVARFDAASYVSLMRSMDLHDVGDLSVAARETGLRVNRIIGVGIDTDILYYPAEVEQWVAEYAAAGLDARYRELASPYGHDAFLIEWDGVEGVLREALEGFEIEDCKIEDWPAATASFPIFNLTSSIFNDTDRQLR